MRDNVIILNAEDDRGHFLLTKYCLRDAGIENELVCLEDGQKVLDFLLCKGEGVKREPGREYLLLLDIRMPKVDGFEILEVMRQDAELMEIPVIIVSTSDAPDNVRRCNELGCDGYVVKPLGANLIEAIEHIDQPA